MKRFIKRLVPAWLLERAKFLYYPLKLRWSRYEDEPEMDGVRVLVVPGDVVVDIGANLGVYTHLLSRLVGPQGKVYSFEPVPRTFALLRWGVRVLSITNVKVSSHAISDRAGQRSMRVPVFADSGKRNYYMAAVVPREQATPVERDLFAIQTKTLDAALSGEPRRVGFIKCDVEGHENAVFRGSELVLSTSRPALLVEVSGNPDDVGSPAGELLALLTKYEYVPCVFEGHGFRRRQLGESQINYFFLTPDHLRRFAV